MDPEVTLELVQILNLYREWSARKGRKHGVHPINAARKEKGQFHTLVGELRQDADRFRRYTRMSLAAFDKLLGPVGREDLRRMWRQCVRSFYAYKMRRTSRKPKFYAELSFLNELSMDQVGVVASKY
ncbi:hypothetical protein AAVH_06823 [Aphelenchoides avenae]|nr:hypothetical protein AAVH_06823 [Aphelenchus avenae]